MSATATNPRPYQSNDHLRGLAFGEAGAIMVLPLRAGDIYFDAAKANHLPRNLPEGEHGSTVLDIGHGVSIRASGNARRIGGAWMVSHLYANQYPSGRELTAKQDERARELIGGMIGRWAATHEDDIAQADDVDRNNGASRLEETIAQHEEALTILRAQLKACEEGDDYTQYPGLPTNR
jgi:hypothetical protein